LSRYSAAFALLADLSLLTLGGALKRKEMISARLGDIVSEIYLLAAALKRFEDEGRHEEDRPILDYLMITGRERIAHAFEGVLQNLPARWAAVIMRLVAFPAGFSRREPKDELVTRLAEMLMTPGSQRDRLTVDLYLGEGRDGHPLRDLELAFELAVAAPRLSCRWRPHAVPEGARRPRAPSRPSISPCNAAGRSCCASPLRLAECGFDLRVILGCVNVIADEMNPARVAALRLGMGADDAGLHRADQLRLRHAIDRHRLPLHRATARHDLILAGGTEALSHAPLVLSARRPNGSRHRHSQGRSRPRGAGRFPRPTSPSPWSGSRTGLTDPITDMNMGQTAESSRISSASRREAADAYALESHHRLARAQDQGWLDGEVAPAFDRDGTLHDRDDGVRPDSSKEKLAKLNPVFEKPYGKVTPGNSSQITDGAAWVILASEAAVEKHGLTPRARILDSEWSALDPSIMGLGPTSRRPAHRAPRLKRDGIDLWELNEAFAAQVLACLAAWEDADYCREVLGLDAAFGRIDRRPLNVDGGAIASAIRSAPAATASCCTSSTPCIACEKRGIATECIGGGQGGAMLIEAA
jgi:acetyl-CoA C-acetyltransferase